MNALRQILTDAESIVSPDPRPSSPVGAPVRRGAFSSLRRAWQEFAAIVARIDDSLVGDLIGGACLFLITYLFIVIAGVLS